MSCDENTTEEETRMRFIDPKLKEVGWQPDLMRLEYRITNGRIIPEGRKGKRTEPSIADYVLQVAQNYPIAIVEAKSCNLPHDKGMQQAHTYAEKMKLNFAYSTNGLQIEEYDFITKQQKTIDKFPTPQELLERLKKHNKLDDKQMEVLLAPFDRSSRDPAGVAMEPRYYQEIAINASDFFYIGRKKKNITKSCNRNG